MLALADVSAAANHSLATAGAADAAQAMAVATTLAGLVVGEGRTGAVILNNAVTAQIAAMAVTVTASGADVTSCYCPSRAADLVNWGSPVECGSSCGTTGTAGRFVVIGAQSPWTAAVFAQGLFGDRIVRSTAVVRLP